MTGRTIDPEQNWFFQEGYQDGRDGLRAIAPDEARYLFQRWDYHAGYAAGAEQRAAGDMEYDPAADSIGSWRDAIAELKRKHNPKVVP